MRFIRFTHFQVVAGADQKISAQELQELLKKIGLGDYPRYARLFNTHPFIHGNRISCLLRAVSNLLINSDHGRSRNPSPIVDIICTQVIGVLVWL